jgi:Protein of unknown function (DUF938)
MALTWSTFAAAPSPRDSSPRQLRAIVDQSERCLLGFCRRRASRSKLDPVPGSSFAKALPGLVWLPSDPDSASRASIKAWSATEGLANVRAPVAIDVRKGVWGVEDDAPFDAMISLNMVHIAPWEAALGLLAGAGRLLRPDGVLVVYGPFMLGGTHTAASNAAFDADLKRRDPRWGVRDVDNLVGEAALYRLELREIVEMPVNNLSLVFVKAGPPVPA